MTAFSKRRNDVAGGVTRTSLSYHPVRQWENTGKMRFTPCSFSPARNFHFWLALRWQKAFWLSSVHDGFKLKSVGKTRASEANPKPSLGKMSHSVSSGPPKEKGVSDFCCMSVSSTSSQTGVREWEERRGYEKNKKQKVAASYNQWLLNWLMWVERTVGWLWFDSHVLKAMFLTTCEKTKPSIPCKIWLSFQCTDCLHSSNLHIRWEELNMNFKTNAEF